MVNMHATNVYAFSHLIFLLKVNVLLSRKQAANHITDTELLPITTSVLLNRNVGSQFTIKFVKFEDQSLIIILK